MFQVGICVDNADPKGLRRVKIRTASIQNETKWVLPLFGGAMSFPVPRKKDSVILFYDNDLYENLFYMPAPTTQISGSPVGDRAERAIAVLDSFEADLGDTNLSLDADAGTAKLRAANVTIGADESTEFIVMATKIKNWIKDEINDQLKNLDVPTGVGPSGPASSGVYQTANAVQDPSESDLGSTKHKVE